MINRRDLLLSSLAAAASSVVAEQAKGRQTFLPCINQVTTLEAPLELALEAYAMAGFRHVELWFPRLAQEGLRPAQVAAALKNSGLTAASACASNAGLSAPEDKLPRMLDGLRRNFETAQALGVPRYVVYSGEGSASAADFERAPQRLARYAELAKPYGVRIALEFIAGARLIGCFRTALEMVRSVNHPNLGVCLDTFHLYGGVSKVEDILEARPGEVAHVHFHDAPSTMPRELWRDPDRLPPGEGTIPLSRITEALRAAGYQGVLSVELFGQAFQKGDPREVAHRCFRAVARYC
jgi:sugar phosphate isomerase/epimerase